MKSLLPIAVCTAEHAGHFSKVPARDAVKTTGLPGVKYDPAVLITAMRTAQHVKSITIKPVQNLIILFPEYLRLYLKATDLHAWK